MTFLPPGERIDGTTAECAHLHLLLACFRASPPPMRMPGVAARPLPDLLGTGIIDKDVFSAGHAIMATRYERLGVRALLPLERVWAGSLAARRTGTADRAWPNGRPRAVARHEAGPTAPRSGGTSLWRGWWDASRLQGRGRGRTVRCPPG
jgi:hypothetical protein